MYRLIIRNILFLFDPEWVHDVVCALLRIRVVAWILGLLYGYNNPVLERDLFGLRFQNPVGLAAGFDKNAEISDALGRLGFGFVEIGTVTPEPQQGNEKPRLFRLKNDRALINRMGFNNSGMVRVSQNLKKRRHRVLIGGNIGKNKTTPNENALDDYTACFRELAADVDYFVVNVSSPNTPGLRSLQEKEPLTRILTALKKLGVKIAPGKPILIKIAPDLSDEQLDDIIAIVEKTGIAGVIATNTTIGRENLQTTKDKITELGDGGLSGKPLEKRATEIIRYLVARSKGAFPVIGVGGIFSAEDTLEKLEAGASLVQLYTGFIYEGPALIKKINRELARRWS